MTAYAPADLLANIIRPVLAALGLDPDPDAEALLLRTCAQESRLGEYRTQLGGGPALGIYQMEPATCSDLWANWLFFRPHFSNPVSTLLNGEDRVQALVQNDRYATAMARFQYMRHPDLIPPASDLAGQAALYLRLYNGGGKATAAEFIANARSIDPMTAEA